MQHLQITLVQGKQGPHYPDGQEIVCEGITITEQGTEQDLPIVDFRMRGPDGDFYLMVMTGRLVATIAKVIEGVNLRNHGDIDPQNRVSAKDKH